MVHYPVQKCMSLGSILSQLNPPCSPSRSNSMEQINSSESHIHSASQGIPHRWLHRFITMFTPAHYRALFNSTLMLYTLSNPIQDPPTPNSPKWSLSYTFSDLNFGCLSRPWMPRALPTSSPPWFHHPNNILVKCKNHDFPHYKIFSKLL
jgi:hypothetical protein